MRKHLAAGLSLLLLIAAPPAFAWDEEGHQVVAAIAQYHLTPEAREGVQLLLGSAQLHERNVASWADDVRSSQPSTEPWHYVDLPRSADTYSQARDCVGNACVVGKLEDFSRQLADTTVSLPERLTALKFLVHFAGDLHQPLHCLDDDDHGGNKIQIRYPGRLRTTNLHAVWDSHILQDAMGGQALVDYANALDSTISRADIQAWMSASTPASWANEAHKAAQGLYQELPAANLRGLRVLPKSYGSDHKARVELQLKQGGIRLASLLNKAFGAGSGTGSAQPQVPLYPPNQRPKLVTGSARD